ncbi:hypothetical protein JWJ90_09835 [Desulfobulbus rhabdoformis]|uniref:hypothetical protein n=1 Tax=Desulfobulbus rhabdoformis TaxID=34032 RepID=UPI0019647577|nr:hypothetical protein [Desulfobulbus rhabdoformis]MBM9614590.1 hypothetical protein [Desulfobulbus rhabdoformis]
MNVLLFRSNQTESGERLKRSIKALDNLESLTDCWNMQELRRYFQTPDPLPETIVLQAKSRQELQALSPFRFRLEQVFFVLILPDADAETVASAHQLRPRFIAYQDSDFSEVEAVLNRLEARSTPARDISSGLTP